MTAPSTEPPGGEPEKPEADPTGILLSNASHQPQHAAAIAAEEQLRKEAGALHSVSVSLTSARVHLTGTPPRMLPELPSLLMQAVVERGAKVTDGHIIEAVLQPWFDIVAALQRNPTGIFQIPWDKWEEMIAGAYRRVGAEVILTPRSGDRGRDVIAILRGIGTVRVIESVKAYGPGHLVEYDEVRALYGVVEADKASKGFLTTTSDFAPRLRDDPLLKPLLGPRLELINGDQLLRRLAELAKR